MEIRTIVDVKENANPSLLRHLQPEFATMSEMVACAVGNQSCHVDLSVRVRPA